MRKSDAAMYRTFFWVCFLEYTYKGVDEIGCLYGSKIFFCVLYLLNFNPIYYETFSHLNIQTL